MCCRHRVSDPQLRQDARCGSQNFICDHETLGSSTLANTVSKSASLRALRTYERDPRASAAACRSLVIAMRIGLVGFKKCKMVALAHAATRVRLGPTCEFCGYARDSRPAGFGS
jgi:hypothetical protein